MKNKNIRIVGDDGKESPLEYKKKRGGSLAAIAMLFSFPVRMFKIVNYLIIVPFLKFSTKYLLIFVM